MIFKVSCAYVNTQGKIKLDEHTFQASDASKAKVTAQEYFSDLHSYATQFIYSEPVELRTSTQKAPGMVQVNYDSALGRQIIIGGDAGHGSYVTGDEVVIG